MSGRAVKLLLTLLAATLLAASLPSMAGAEEFTQQFGRDSLNPRVFKFIGGSAKKAIQETDEGLLISLPFTGVKTSQAGVGTTFALEGDFEVTAGYRLVDLNKVDRGYGAGVMLALITAEKPAVTVNLSHRKLKGGKATLGTNIWTTVREKMKSDQKPFSIATTVNGGQLRVTRTGSTIRFLVAEGTSGEFRELRQNEFGTEPLQSVHVLADTGGSTQPVKVLLTKLSIRADGMPMGLPSRQRRGVWMTWIVLALVGGAVLIGAAVWYWRRPAQTPAGAAAKPVQK